MTIEEAIARFENLGQGYGSQDGGRCMRLNVAYADYAQQIGLSPRGDRTGQIGLTVVEAHYLLELAQELRDALTRIALEPIRQDGDAISKKYAGEIE